MEEWHAPTRLIHLNGERFPIVKIIDVNNLIFSTCPCVLRTGQSRRHLADRMNTGVPQKSGNLSIFLIYLYIYRCIFMGVSIFSSSWTSLKRQAQVLSPKKVDSVTHLPRKLVFMRALACLPNCPPRDTQDRFWVKCPPVLFKDQ